MKATITVGVPGSGKSTYAFSAVLIGKCMDINRDTLRMEMFDLDVYDDYVFSKENEDWVTRKANQCIEIAAKNRVDIIISDTNLNEYHRLNLVDRLLRMGFEVNYEVFDIPYDEMIKRNRERSDKNIPLKVLDLMFKKMIKFNADLNKGL